VTLATAAVLMWRRRWPWLLTLILVVPGGALLNELIKIAFHRARPKFDVPILAVKGYGFPSGHAMMATLLYGLLAVLLVRTLRDVRWRMLVVGVAGSVVVLVGISRMYLGAHYLSDILAAVAAGVAWLVLCLTADTSHHFSNVDLDLRMHPTEWPGFRRSVARPIESRFRARKYLPDGPAPHLRAPRPVHRSGERPALDWLGTS
jgi:membrane-associated phospholipid phosphatase